MRVLHERARLATTHQCLITITKQWRVTRGDVSKPCVASVLVYAYLYAYMCLSVSVWKCSQEAYIMWSTAKCSPNASDDLSRQLIKLECPEKIKARFERAADP